MTVLASIRRMRRLCDRILAWRAATEAGEDDPEIPLSHVGLPTSRVTPRFRKPKNCGWCGIPPLVVEKMLPFVTVFSIWPRQCSRRRAAGRGGAAGNSRRICRRCWHSAAIRHWIRFLDDDDRRRRSHTGGFQSLSDDDRSGVERWARHAAEVVILLSKW